MMSLRRVTRIATPRCRSMLPENLRLTVFVKWSYARKLKSHVADCTERDRFSELDSERSGVAAATGNRMLVRGRPNDFPRWRGQPGFVRHRVRRDGHSESGT